jgi:hypothetical protein
MRQNSLVVAVFLAIQVFAIAAAAAPAASAAVTRTHASRQQDGTEYLFFRIKATWYEAERNCVAIGGHLASLPTERDSMIVQHLCTADVVPRDEDYGGCWIGLNDIDKEGAYNWTDGSPVTYTGWFNGTNATEPTGLAVPEEDCVFVEKSAKAGAALGLLWQSTAPPPPASRSGMHPPTGKPVGLGLARTHAEAARAPLPPPCTPTRLARQALQR